MSDHMRNTERRCGRTAGGWLRRCVFSARACAYVGACLCWLSATAIADEPTVAPPPAAPSNADDLTPARLLNDIESAGREKQARLNRIRQQLQKLAEASRRAEADQLPVSPPEPAQVLPPAPQLNADSLEPPTQPRDLHAVPEPPDDHAPAPLTPPDPTHAPPAAPAAHEPGNAHLAPESVQHADPELHATETLVGATIDRIALADSLFGTGQSDLALQTYSSIDLLKQPIADRYWIEYQLANCHRRLGDLAEAEKRYRRLAGLVDAGWCAVHARWWLDALSTRTSLQRDLESIRISRKSVEEQLNARPQQ